VQDSHTQESEETMIIPSPRTQIPRCHNQLPHMFVQPTPPWLLYNSMPSNHFSETHCARLCRRPCPRITHAHLRLVSLPEIECTLKCTLLAACRGSHRSPYAFPTAAPVPILSAPPKQTSEGATLPCQCAGPMSPAIGASSEVYTLG
jgi:hypothetical protein